MARWRPAAEAPSSWPRREARRPRERGQPHHPRRSVDPGSGREREAVAQETLECRLYPFERLADGSWSIRPPRHGELEAAKESGEACLAVEEADGMEALMRAFAVTPESLRVLVEQLREDVSDHRRRQRTDRRPRA